jgi:P-type Ca2+ transporter type 2C
MQYYLQPKTEVLEELQSNDIQGLSVEAVKNKQKLSGLNQLRPSKARQPWLILLEQFNNPLAFVLLGASAFSMYLGEYRDASILAGIVVANALFGFYQEWQAENVLASLKNLITEKCRVLREGKFVEINSTDLVVGDIVFLDEGDGIPADIRLLESQNLATNDFILTGESLPVEKSADIVYTEELPLALQHNCSFMGTTVARGTAKAVVVATGMNTQIGHLANRSQQITENTSPLQKEIASIAKRIILITMVIAVGLFLIRFFTNGDLREAIIFSIGVAAAMVPEGLPAQISVALALGMGRMAKKNAVVKKLASIETLGSATVIASDKTGTITKNQMTITQCMVNGTNFTISGLGYNPEGEVLDAQGNRISQEELKNYAEFLLSGYLASTARINPPDTYHKTWYAIGDPTEASFAVLMMKLGLDANQIDRDYPKIKVYPFDSFRKRISIIREIALKPKNELASTSTYKVYCKGALESILPICTHIIQENQITEFSEKEKHQILELSQTYAAQGLRIIALSYKNIAQNEAYTQEEVESKLTFIGFAMMYDPPHEEVYQAIQNAFRAKMKVAMITGDNEITAKAIANQIGMMNENEHFPQAIRGEQLQKMSDEEIIDCFKQRAVIFSRVSPDDKLRVVDVLKRHGEVVAVTGDGVNDTLSLKKADIGVAMGLSGSKVAQEAANMVLLDDNFSTIVVAIEEGRTIYKNLEKTVLASICANVAELSCVLIGFLGGFWQIPIPILAMQILMVDLVGEMFPLLMLTYDPPEQDLMQQAPRQSGKYMLHRRSIQSILFAGGLIGSLSYMAFLIVYFFNPHETRHYETCLTISYTGIILGQFMNILVWRTEGSVFSEYFFSNPRLLLGFALSFICVLFIIYLPFFNEYLHTAPLMLQDWAVVMLVPLIFLMVQEGRKRILKKG